MDRIFTARRLISSKDIALSSVRLQPSGFVFPGAFAQGRANTRERRVTVSFPTANAPVSIYHGLGFTPSGYTVLSRGVGSGGTWIAGGKIYNDFPLPCTSQSIVLKCDTANTVADILVR